MNPQINIIDYRNGRYQGQVKDNLYHGLGIIIDDDFSFYISEWRNNLANGPCFLIFPDEKIFYGTFNNDRAYDLCCYDMGDQCQIYATFDRDGFLKGRLSVVFPLLDIVLAIGNYSEDGIGQIEQYSFRNENQKWTLIEDILNKNIPSEYKNLKEFLYVNFLQYYPSILEEYNGSDYFFGYKGNGLGFKLTEHKKIKSIGYYNESKVLMGVGKKNIIGEDKTFIEEGVFLNLKQTVEYSSIQDRPLKSKQYIQNFYKKSLEFVNGFVKVRQFKEIKSLFTILNIRIKEDKTKKIAQQLLENPKFEQFPRVISTPKKKVQLAGSDIIVDKIRSEIQKSKSKNKTDRKQVKRGNIQNDYLNKSQEDIGKLKTKYKRDRDHEQSPTPVFKTESRYYEQKNYESRYNPEYDSKNEKQQKFPPKIFANLGQQYQVKKKKKDSPINKLTYNDERNYFKSKKNDSPNRGLERSVQKLEQLTKMYDKLPKKQREERHVHRKYNYNDTNQIYSNHNTTSPIKASRKVEEVRRSPSPYAPDRKKYVYFQQKK